jgi:hypothetical protein
MLNWDEVETVMKTHYNMQVNVIHAIDGLDFAAQVYSSSSSSSSSSFLFGFIHSFPSSEICFTMPIWSSTRTERRWQMPSL